MNVSHINKGLIVSADSLPSLRLTVVLDPEA